MSLLCRASRAAVSVEEREDGRTAVLSPVKSGCIHKPYTVSVDNRCLHKNEIGVGNIDVESGISHI
jgi:hypothetical protein